MTIELKNLHGKEIENYLDALAGLRIEVFKEFPYLYDGHFDYEKKYFSTYIECPDSLAILAIENSKPIGASTCIPFVYETEEFRKPLEAAGFDIQQGFYFGESIILKASRGKGLGHRFFAGREAHATETFSDLQLTAFCAVNRPETHPLRPEGYRNLHPFWSRLGYKQQSNAVAKYKWKDIDQKDETTKELTFWTKSW